jgi:hypothetical protein
MIAERNPVSLVALSVLVLVTAIIATISSSILTNAQESPLSKPIAPEEGPIAGGMSRLYVFRPIRSFGAHVDDDVTVNGVPVHRLTPGTGFYCDLPPGDYVIDVASHKTSPLKVSTAAGQPSYVSVMLHPQGGVSPRGGALPSDQSFDVRLLEPDFGAHRTHEYPLTRATCRP